MRLILLGPVGCGKGTQASLLCSKFGIPHISTGDIFRTNIKENTPLGVIAKNYLDKGELVPDELTNQLVSSRISQSDCARGFILDGYPRNLSQSQYLDTITKIDKVIMIDISEDKIIKRLTSRRICKDCKQSTSIDWLINGKCEKCGGDVYTRDDDKPDVIKNRLITQAVSSELIEFYKQKGVFSRVEARDNVEDTYSAINSSLDKGNND